MVGLPFTWFFVSPQSRFEAQFSGFFSHGASGAHFPCPVQVAGVAVHSIRVAITVQLVFWLGSWVTEDSLWRARPLGCAARPEFESLNVRVHDLDMPSAVGGGHHQGVNIAVYGNPRRQRDVVDGATLTHARRRKELAYRRAWSRALFLPGV